MSLDLVAAAILGALFLLGTWRGFVPSLLGLVSLVLGYIGAVFAAKLASPAVASLLGLPSLLAAPLAGTAGFLVTVLCFAVMASPLRRRDRERALAEGRGAADRLLGGLVGSVRGAAIVVLLALLTSWIDAARDVTRNERLAAAPDTEGSLAVAASSRILETAVAAAVGPDGAGGLAGRFVARPEAAMQMMETIARNPSIRSLRNDRVFWMYVEQGQASNAVQRPDFQELGRDPDLRQQLAALGAIDAEAAASAEAFERHMEGVLQKIGPRLRALREDPELKALAEDPEVLARLQSGDPWALLSDTRIHRIASRMAEGL